MLTAGASRLVHGAGVGATLLLGVLVHGGGSGGLGGVNREALHPHVELGASGPRGAGGAVRGCKHKPAC